MRLISELAGEGHTILMSTHQPDLALRWFNRAVLLHEGEVLGDGAPREILTPEALTRLYAVDMRLVEADGDLFVSASP